MGPVRRVAVRAGVAVLAGAVVVLGGTSAWAERPVARSVQLFVAPGGAGLAPAPQPFAGPDGECSLPDPTGADGCVTPATAHLADRLTEAGHAPTGCWSEHAWNPSSDHPRGLACDLPVGRAGTFPDAAERARGWTTARWLTAHADALQVRYVIYAGRIWFADRAHRGWAPYDGGGVYDAADPTGGHHDHVHVSLHP